MRCWPCFGSLTGAIVNIAQSGASTGAKALWIVFVLVLPLVGFLAWLVAGPRAR